MYKVIIFILAFFSLNSFSQVIPPSDFQRLNDTVKKYQIGIVSGPYMKLSFTILIKNSDNKVSLVNGDGTILYVQINSLGNFQITSEDKSLRINIFDEKGGQQITSFVKYNRGDTTIYKFGNDDVEIKVTIESLPKMYELKNKHFVRFMCFSSFPMLNRDLAISLENLSPPDQYTEPESDGITNNEQSIIVKRKVYSMFKNYIIYYKPKLLMDRTIRQRSNFTMEIDVDYKSRFFLSNRQTIDFLNNFVSFLKSEHYNNYINIFSSIISDAKYALENEGKQPIDPN